MTEFMEPNALQQQREGPQAPIILDVRGAEEYAAGHIPGARHIPADELEARMDEIPDDRPVVPY